MDGMTDYGFLTQNFNQSNNLGLNNGFDRSQILRDALLFSMSDEEREQIEQDKERSLKSKDFMDAVNNPLQAFGSNTYDLTYNGLGQTSRRNISWQITKQDSIMRDVPYFDKASSWKATMALINGIDLNSKEPKVGDLTLVQKDIADLFTPQHSVIKWGDFYGGSGGLLIFDDCEDEDDYMKPIVASQIKKGSFRGIKPLSRLYQIIPDLSSKLVTKVGEEYGIYGAEEIGQPEFFRINISGDTESQGKYFRVHRSRLLLYSSSELTWVEKRIEMYFGPSLLERAYSSFARYESMLAQINKLAQRSNIPVLNVAGMPMASLQNERFVEYVASRIKGINFGVSAGNMIVLNDIEKEQFKYETAQFTNLTDILKHYRENLSADLSAPTGILFNDTGENDSDKYLLVPKEIQERIVRSWYRKLIPIVYRNRFGKTLKDFDFTFKSLEIPTEKEKAEKMKLVVEMLDILYDKSIIDGASYQKMLIAAPNNISDIPNEITEEYINYVAQGLEGKPFNKMEADIMLATALNHANEMNENSNLSNKVASSQGGKEKGGDPKKKKATVRVPITKREK